jgi:glucan-binding YG repeat protein
MEETQMKIMGVIGTTALFLLFAATVPAFAQEDKAKPEKQDEAKPAKQEEKAKPAKQEEAKPAKQQDQAKPPKQEQQAKTDKQEPQPKPAKQQEEAKPTKQENQAKQEEKAQPGKQQQDNKQAQQEGRNKNGGQQHAQRTEVEQQRQRSIPELRLSVRGSGHIPDQRFNENFGEGHRFQINEPVLVGGFSRFQYGGFWFGFVQPWPAQWYYTDDVYVVFVDGGYYLCNPYYPDDRVSISVEL